MVEPLGDVDEVFDLLGDHPSDTLHRDGSLGRLRAVSKYFRESRLSCSRHIADGARFAFIYHFCDLTE